MKRFVTPLVLCLILTPALAQDKEGDLDEGMDLLGKGAELLLRGLMNEMEPALKDLSDQIGELNAYHPPEILPNGDIIIRRKVPLTGEPSDEGEIEL
ncbi:MAG: AAA+ family ATPase [Paracoccaceae bacterium]